MMEILNLNILIYKGICLVRAIKNALFKSGFSTWSKIISPGRLLRALPLHRNEIGVCPRCNITKKECAIRDRSWGLWKILLCSVTGHSCSLSEGQLETTPWVWLCCLSTCCLMAFEWKKWQLIIGFIFAYLQFTDF